MPFTGQLWEVTGFYIEAWQVDSKQFLRLFHRILDQKIQVKYVNFYQNSKINNH